MRAGFWVVLASLALSACYQVQAPVVTQGVRAEGIADGTWMRSDGTKVSVAWDGTALAYRIGAGGVVRLKPVGPQLYLADYQAERDIVLLVKAQPDLLTFFLPPEPVEKILAQTSGAAIKAGPIKLLEGTPNTVWAYLDAMAQRHDLIEAGRLTRAVN